MAIPARRLRGLPDQIRRSGGQYVACRRELTVQASVLVLAPRDEAEMKSLQQAFEREDLVPRQVMTWGGVETHRPGIFFCDPTLDPSITGRAAVARAIAWLGRAHRRAVPPAMVNPCRCRACGTCVDLCDFGAPALIELDNDQVGSWIDPLICTGCGTCAARCPSGAITAGVGTDQELQATLVAILNNGVVQHGNT